MAFDSSEPIAGVRPGEILAGKYRVERVLGAGGMGVVVAARHLQLDERVALKFLRPGAVDSPDAIARFIREARNAVKIKSEHVARVTDVGQLETGAPYMVMEYLEGEDLQSWLGRHGPLAVEQAVEFVIQACVALAEAHALGIVHRDLKPANLFAVRGADGRLAIKVLDFGISKMTSLSLSARDAATHTGAILGSPMYMSPEQMQSAKEVDLRTDIWALGVTLYQLLSGSTPFLGDTIPEIIVRIATHPPTQLRASRPQVPEALEGVVMRCLQKDRRLRYANVADLAIDLSPYGPAISRGTVDKVVAIVRATARPTTEPPPGPAPAVASDPPKARATQTALAHTTAASRSAPFRRWGLAAGGAALVAGVSLLLVLKTPGSSRPPASSTPASPPVIAPSSRSTRAESPAPSAAPSPVPPSLSAALAPAPAETLEVAPRASASSAPALPAPPSSVEAAGAPESVAPLPAPRSGAPSRGAKPELPAGGAAPASRTSPASPAGVSSASKAPLAPAPGARDPADPIFGLQPK